MQVPFIEGAITDSKDLDLSALTSLESVDITLELASGKIIAGSGMWFAGEGSVTTEEGEIAVRFESETPLEEL